MPKYRDAVKNICWQALDLVVSQSEMTRGGGTSPLLFIYLFFPFHFFFYEGPSGEGRDTREKHVIETGEQWRVVFASASRGRRQQQNRALFLKTKWCQKLKKYVFLLYQSKECKTCWSKRIQKLTNNRQREMPLLLFCHFARKFLHKMRLHKNLGEMSVGRTQ